MSILDPKAWAAALAAQGAPIAEDVVEKAMTALGAEELQAEDWAEAIMDRLAAKYQLAAELQAGKLVFKLEPKGTN